jgi:hypothetical protein
MTRHEKITPLIPESFGPRTSADRGGVGSFFRASGRAAPRARRVAASDRLKVTLLLSLRSRQGQRRSRCTWRPIGSVFQPRSTTARIRSIRRRLCRSRSIAKCSEACFELIGTRSRPRKAQPLRSSQQLRVAGLDDAFHELASETTSHINLAIAVGSRFRAYAMAAWAELALFFRWYRDKYFSLSSSVLVRP